MSGKYRLSEIPSLMTELRQHTEELTLLAEVYPLGTIFTVDGDHYRVADYISSIKFVPITPKEESVLRACVVMTSYVEDREEQYFDLKFIEEYMTIVTVENAAVLLTSSYPIDRQIGEDLMRNKQEESYG